MNILPEDLAPMSYELDEELDHSELIPFVRKNLATLNPFSVIYWAINLVLIAATALLPFRESHMTVFDAITKIFQGIFLFFIILLPIHELIHGLFYKIAGAKKIQFVAVWRKLVFYCIADGYVANIRSFLLIAMAPFLVINTVLLTLMIFATPGLSYVLLGSLLIHTGGCSGDFGLASYFYKNRNLQPVTFDDARNHKSFFFLKLSKQ